MTIRGIEHFPQPEDWTEFSLQQLGYRRYSVSIFDHWLTENEWSLHPFVSLERARANGFEQAFHEQNRRFRAFYRSIFDGGVFRLTGSRSRPQVTWHARWDRRLKKAVTAMVEDRTWGAEFYAPVSHIRISSGDARTDTVFLERNADEVAIRNLVMSHGLNLIG
ncbi:MULTISPECIES: hypothetical protein [Sphingomonas]|uniref:Uncharacterized protein n=1 Tax=Sphingomonas molluscorum TaxID=418184 RepID=A0ABU8Q5D6_9SPHN|nr:hypothetical protein [Sphingomonas sp. JUb134]MBM7405705.1 hypothetical protein [Sphingomonas sp. JUb134]